jgi:HAE1 family hydrophobic/amphiphilic exporter-1
MRSFIALAVRRRVAVLMTALAVVAFGIVGYQRLALDLLPDISYPSLTVQTEFPDTAPAEVENLVTRPVEEAVGVLKGLKTVHSVSRSGVSEVTLEFDWGSDMDVLSMDVRDKLDRLVLPAEAEDPIVLRFDPSLDPVMRLAVSGPSDLTVLRQIADKQLKQEFETIKGVAAAQIKGGLEEEIQIDVHQERLAAMGVPLSRVGEVVGVSNINLPGGSLEDQQSQYLIRTVNEYDTVEEIGELILRQDERGSVRLKDVADVLRGAKEREEITRVNGVESVEIAIFKEGDANTVSTARSVHERINGLGEKLPPDHRVSVLFDQSRFIDRAVSEVRNSALMGGLLAILVLFAFLRDLRSTLIIAISIPLSLVAAFLFMYRMDISLNIMSLGGLTLGVGMLVDNSIVVLESIFRKRQEGLPIVKATVEGTHEVAGAVVASTLTTVAVFLPIVFVEGIAGQLFKDMALTVTLSLLASLVVAITMIPMLAALGRQKSADKLSMPDLEHSPQTLGAFSRTYERIVRAALRRKWTTIAIAFGIFAASLGAVRLIGTQLIPQISEGEFFFEVNMPEGTPLTATDQVMKTMETAAGAEGGVETVFSTVGSRLVAGGMSLNTKAENLGQVNVVLKNRSDAAGELAATDRLRERFQGVPDLEVKSGKPTYFSLKTPVEIVLYGESLEELRDYSLELANDLERVPGLVDVRSSLEAGSPELQIIFDRARLATLGLDMRTLSETLRDRVQGTVPTRFKEEDRQIDIRVRNRISDRATAQDVRNLVLPGPNGEPIRLTTVADVRVGRGPAEIHRLQQQRAAIVSADVEDRSLGAVMGDIRETLRREPPPGGISAELGGQDEEMRVSYASLRFAIALAIFLVYLVMAATFESLVHPFVVMFTIPLALVGVVLGLLVTGTEISVIVLIGAVMLVGIVVNNAIILVDKVNQLRRQGVAKEDALVLAGHIRLRPILMTTLTTVLGLVPMALSFGEGSELRSPLAITVAFGLSSSTLLTLVVIPAVYMAVPSHVAVEESERIALPARGAAAEGPAS